MTSNRINDGPWWKRKKVVKLSKAGPETVTSDQFRMIRTNIKFLPGERENKIFLITSPGRKEGKSTTTANLAVSLAQQKDKVLLIDANIREPTIQRIFDIPSQVGLTDILTNKRRFDEVVYPTGIGELDVLVSGSTFYNPAELLGNETMTYLLNVVVRMYNVVLIDAPSILTTTETRVLSNQCDGVILVLQRGKTKIDKIVEARRILDLSHGKLVGSIMNKR